MAIAQLSLPYHDYLPNFRRFIFAFKIRGENFGSILLILFLILATLIYHNPIGDSSQINGFLKNIGLIGGLLMVLTKANWVLL